MKYIKLFWFDIRNGLLRNPMLFAAPVVIALAACMDLTNRVSAWNDHSCFTVETNGSFADHMMYVYGGMDRPEPGNLFIFPVRWAVVFLVLPFITLNYPYKDIQGLGQQILTRTGGRIVWWLSKCLWNILSVLVYHGFIFGTTALFSIVMKCSVPGEINKDLQYIAFHISISSFMSDDAPWPLTILVIPVLVSLCINLLQMTLALFMKPIFSFLAIAFLMVSSAYFLSPYLIGNYAMSIRYDMVVKGGVSTDAGIVISLALIIISIGVGMIRFHQYDILNEI